jgi:hypothetical protein
MPKMVCYMAGLGDATKDKGILSVSPCACGVEAGLLFSMLARLNFSVASSGPGAEELLSLRKIVSVIMYELMWPLRMYNTRSTHRCSIMGSHR